VLEDALEVAVHEGAFKEHLDMLEDARKAAARDTAALEAEVRRVRACVRACSCVRALAAACIGGFQT